MNIILFATNRYQSKCFEEAFAKHNNVVVYDCLFEQAADKIDCLVSPANSFGLMDGGMDAAITNYFGDQLQRRVQKRIINEYAGEQPVGTSFVIETNDERIPYLAHTPTMRVPAIISGTDNVYRAMKATLVAVNQWFRSDVTIGIPAFGAGCGQMHPYKLAQQMALALSHVANPPTAIDWNYAKLRDYEINGRA